MRLSAFDVKVVYRKGECNEVAGCISRDSLAARFARTIKQVGARSANTTASEEN